MANQQRAKGNSWLRVLLSAFLLVFFSGLPVAKAQSNTGTILGTVSDQSGAVIPDADVTVTNLGTGQQRSVKTDEGGGFTLSNLQVGHYSITVTHAGFGPVKIADTELQVAQRATINPAMHPAVVGEEVTVIANAVPLLNETSSSVGQVIDTTTVQSMPLNGRNFWQLTQLTPGVNYIQGGQNIATGGTSIRASAVNVDVNGLSSSWTGWYLDGANITEIQLGGTIIQPNVDALQEFKVESSSMGADYGHTPTVVNATLRSGTNEIHGTAYDFLRNNVLDAKNYFYAPPTGSTQRAEPLHRNQFGFVVGGPIWKDKTFFFLDAQTTMFTKSQVFNNVVPSDAERGGDFSATGLPTIKNPLTGTQVSYNGTANVIPPSMISSQAKYLLQYIPHANRASGTTSNALVSNLLRQQLEEADLRIDHALTARDQLMGRYSISNNRETDPNGFPAMGNFPLKSRGQDLVLRETHLFSERWINELQASYYRSFFAFTSSLQGQDINTAAGIIGLSGLSPTEYLGFPTITISNYSTFNGQAGNQYPKQNKIRSYQYVDHISYSQGKTNLRFGYELFHNITSYISGSTSTGTFTFNGKYSGDNFADFLMGYPLSAGRAYFRQLWGNSGNFHAMYAQEDYRLKQNLTINAGMRWEINPYYNAHKNQTTGFDFATGKLVIPTNVPMDAQPGTATLYPLFKDRFETTSFLHLPENIRPTDWHNVAPRLGFAYSPSKSTVIRGGYGMFFLFVDNNGLNNSQNSVPFVATQSSNNTATTPTYTLGDFYQRQPIVSANTSGAICAFGFVANSCSTPSLNSVDIHPKNTYIQEWNLSTQRQIGARVSLDLAYVGSKTTHAVEQVQMNDPNPAAGTVQTRRPLPQWGTINIFHFGGYGSYNALQAKVEARNFHGLTLLTAYTYGKSLVNGTYNSGTIENTSAINYYGPANYDLTQNSVTSYLYELPFGKGKAMLANFPKVANGIVDNWNLSGILTLQSGLPYTPTISADQANTGVGGQRPNVVGAVQELKQPKCWYYDSANSSCGTGRTNAFALPTKYTYGNGGINILRGDGLVQFDMTLMKTVHLDSKRTLEVRGSFYNLFNHTTFANPATNIDSSSAGQVTSTLNPSRLGEFAAKIFF